MLKNQGKSKLMLFWKHKILYHYKLNNFNKGTNSSFENIKNIQIKNEI